MAGDWRKARDTARVAMACPPDTRWRNRSEFHSGRDEFRTLLARGSATGHGNRLNTQIRRHGENRISLRFGAAGHGECGQWDRANGDADWAVDALGDRAARYAPIIHVPIAVGDRMFHRPEGTR